MDITKITFSELKSNDITNSFEDLDVNGDGKINNADLNATSDSKIANQIKSLLDVADDDAVLAKTSSAKTSTSSVPETNASSFENDVTNSKGTVYVVMGNLQGCSYCVDLNDEIQNRLSELNEVAQVYNIQWNKNSSLCRSIYIEGGGRGNATFPQIAKFVDGKFVELIDNPRKESSAVQSMIDKAEGTNDTGRTGATSTTATTATTDTPQAEKTADEVAKRAKDLLDKYPVSGSGSGYNMQNPELTAFQKAIDDGIIQTLNDEGFSRDNIIDIINQAFPNIGIQKNDKGGYTCPYGTDSEAKALYSKFIEQISAVTSTDVKALEAEIATLNAEIRTNNAQLNNLKSAIETVKKEVEKAIEDAIKESEEIAEEQKEDAATIVKGEIEAYTNSNGEITYEAFQSNVASKLDDLQGDGTSKLSAVILKLMNAESKMATLQGYMTKFGTLVDANKTLADKIAAKTAEAADDATDDCDAERCDPIGFSANNIQYDFFVDKDNNGDLSNEKEFLGAENGWAEMAALDTNDDGKVTVDEMKDLKLISTDENCNQTVVNASDLFGANDSIDLSSYNAVNTDMENGNTLLGTFSLDLNGQEITNGYNTLDTIDWLDENYNFTDEADGINRFAKGNTTADDIVDFEEQYETFQTEVDELDTKLTDAWAKFNITRTDIKDVIIEGSKKSAENKASDIEDIFKKHANCGEQEEAS